MTVHLVIRRGQKVEMVGDDALQNPESPAVVGSSLSSSVVVCRHVDGYWSS